MNSKKQIFSLNLMTFIWDYTGIEPSLYMEDGGLIYGQYPKAALQARQSANTATQTVR